jgi:hypothetical protein
MADQVYLDEPYLSIRWRSVPQILYAEWKGYATSAEFRAALLKGVQAIREHHVVGYVSDARKAKVFVTEDLQWVSEVWLPQALKAGLKRMAMVTAEQGLGKAIIEEVPRRSTTMGCRCESLTRSLQPRSGRRAASLPRARSDQIGVG